MWAVGAISILLLLEKKLLFIVKGNNKKIVKPVLILFLFLINNIGFSNSSSSDLKMIDFVGHTMGEFVKEFQIEITSIKEISNGMLVRFSYLETLDKKIRWYVDNQFDRSYSKKEILDYKINEIEIFENGILVESTIQNRLKKEDFSNVLIDSIRNLLHFSCNYHPLLDREESKRRKGTIDFVQSELSKKQSLYLLNYPNPFIQEIAIEPYFKWSTSISDVLLIMKKFSDNITKVPIIGQCGTFYRPTRTLVPCNFKQWRRANNDLVTEEVLDYLKSIGWTDEELKKREEKIQYTGNGEY